MSSDTVVQRGRVLRGPAAAKIRGVALDADLSLLRPIVPAAQNAADMEEAARAFREEAARVGYEDGYAAGRAQAAEDGRQHVEALAADAATAVAGLETATTDLAGRQASAVAEVEQTIATMAVQIAEAILARELRVSDSAARDAVVRALRLAPERVDAIVRLHPDDAATVGDLTSLSADRQITVIPDGAVERGGCVVDVGPCRIDAQIGPALERVREVLEA